MSIISVSLSTSTSLPLVSEEAAVGSGHRQTRAVEQKRLTSVATTCNDAYPIASATARVRAVADRRHRRRRSASRDADRDAPRRPLSRWFRFSSSSSSNNRAAPAVRSRLACMRRRRQKTRLFANAHMRTKYVLFAQNMHRLHPFGATDKTAVLKPGNPGLARLVFRHACIRSVHAR